MKKILMVAILLVGQMAFAAKYCGVAQINGTQFFEYGKILDGDYNATITGDSKDPKQVVKLMKDGSCYCVEGTVVLGQGYTDFDVITGLYQCNGGPKIK